PVGAELLAELLQRHLEMGGVELAADATRSQFHHTLGEAETFHHRAVDADLTQLVDDDRHPLAPGAELQQPAQQCRLAGAEEAADHVDRRRGHTHGPGRSTASPSSPLWSPP